MTTTAFGNVIRGIAIGDAWGNPNEFRKLHELTKNNQYGPDLPQKLTITDDTQMSLFLADALDLTREGSMDEVKEAIIEAYLDYYDDPDNDGKRAPGVTVMGSLGQLTRKYNKWDWKTATSTHSDGSGTVMRTAPVAFVNEEDWVGVAAFAAAVTHGTANAIAAAILNVAILRGVLDGYMVPGQLTDWALTLAKDPNDWSLLDTGDWLEDYYVPGGLESGFRELARLLTKAMEDLPGLQATPWAFRSDPSNLSWMGGNAGWRAHETLVIALLAVDMISDDPWESLRRSVTTEGDSDTIGAVAGALIGAAEFAGNYPDRPSFTDEWPSLRDSFEPRFVRWIENEADDYVFSGDLEEELVAAEVKAEEPKTEVTEELEADVVSVPVTVVEDRNIAGFTPEALEAIVSYPTLEPERFAHGEEPDQNPKVRELSRLPSWIKRLYS